MLDIFNQMKQVLPGMHSGPDIPQCVNRCCKENYIGTWLGTCPTLYPDSHNDSERTRQVRIMKIHLKCLCEKTCSFALGSWWCNDVMNEMGLQRNVTQNHWRCFSFWFGWVKRTWHPQSCSAPSFKDLTLECVPTQIKNTAAPMHSTGHPSLLRLSSLSPKSCQTMLGCHKAL